MLGIGVEVLFLCTIHGVLVPGPLKRTHLWGLHFTLDGLTFFISM